MKSNPTTTHLLLLLLADVDIVDWYWHSLKPVTDKNLMSVINFGRGTSTVPDMAAAFQITSDESPIFDLVNMPSWVFDALRHEQHKEESMSGLKISS